MKNHIQYIKGIICIFLAIGVQMANAQVSHKKAAGNMKPAAVKENYIGHEIAKAGAGDHGVYYDTVANKIKPADPVNAAGKQYQDIKVTLDAGDVVIANLTSEDREQSLSLLNSANGHLNVVKTTLDTSSSYNFKLIYKTNIAATYVLRVTSKKRVPKDHYEWQYYYDHHTSYRISSLISTPASGVINDSPTICDQVKFLLRQRLTGYMQITGAISDTSMDSQDKKKIDFINHFSTFTLDKNSKAKISVSAGSGFITFDQSLFYSSKSDALQAQRYFIENFKTCLGAEWAGEEDSSDPHWYKFKRQGYSNIDIILYPEYNYVEILM